MTRGREPPLRPAAGCCIGCSAAPVAPRGLAGRPPAMLEEATSKGRQLALLSQLHRAHVVGAAPHCLTRYLRSSPLLTLASPAPARSRPAGARCKAAAHLHRVVIPLMRRAQEKE